MPNRNIPANKNVNQPNRKRRRVRKYDARHEPPRVRRRLSNL